MVSLLGLHVHLRSDLIMQSPSPLPTPQNYLLLGAHIPAYVSALHAILHAAGESSLHASAASLPKPSR